MRHANSEWAPSVSQHAIVQHRDHVHDLMLTRCRPGRRVHSQTNRQWALTNKMRCSTLQTCPRVARVECRLSLYAAVPVSGGTAAVASIDLSTSRRQCQAMAELSGAVAADGGGRGTRSAAVNCHCAAVSGTPRDVWSLSPLSSRPVSQPSSDRWPYHLSSPPSPLMPARDVGGAAW